jgi:hypothetical protein
MMEEDVCRVGDQRRSRTYFGGRLLSPTNRPHQTGRNTLKITAHPTVTEITDKTYARALDRNCEERTSSLRSDTREGSCLYGV